MIDETSPEYVEALARGLSIIAAFDEVTPEMTLSDLARKVGLPVATVRRNVLTLEALGYVRRHNRLFTLAPRVLMLGSTYLRTARIDETMMPELRRLSESFGDASSIGVLNGTDVLYVAHFSQERAARSMARLGASYPAYATSMGRVLLASLTPEALDGYFAAYRPRRLTDSSISDEAGLREILGGVREAGHAVTVDQLDYGITALAVPVRDPAGRVVAAINSSGYTPHLSA